MTTIAFDGKSLAADSLITEGNTRSGYMNKIIKLDNGGYVAGCGDAHGSQLIADWINGVTAQPPTDKQLEDTQVIYVDAKGNCKGYDGTVAASVPGSNKEAIGSGADFARVALEMGQTAEQAVKMAIKFDIFSGGKVQVVHIDREKKSKRAKIKAPVIEIEQPVD